MLLCKVGRPNVSCINARIVAENFLYPRVRIVCWEKAARYLEVEERYWYCKPGQYVIDPKEAVDLVDEVGRSNSSSPIELTMLPCHSKLEYDPCVRHPGYNIHRSI